MSSVIEFARRAYKANDEDYLALNLLGESNVTEVTASGERIARDWNYFDFGWYFQIIREACKWAGDTEGGMLRYRNGFTKPENYIKNWRKTLKNAGTFEDFLKDFNAIARIWWWKDAPGDSFHLKPSDELIEKLEDSGFKVTEEKKRKSIYSDDFGVMKTYRKKIETVDDLRNFASLNRDDKDVHLVLKPNFVR